MHFGLKNPPSEFQTIMNNILSDFQDFTVVYIDDVLVFSLNLEKNFKHISICIDIIKRNGLVVSIPYLKLFETKIRFLGFEIYLGNAISFRGRIV